MSKHNVFSDRKLLYESILHINNESECEGLINCLLTPNEISMLSQRINIAVSLLKGNKYVEVTKIVGASTATVGRVKQAMFYSKDSDICIRVLNRLLEE